MRPYFAATTLVVGLLLAGLVQPALACRCTDPSVKAAYKRADAVARVHILADMTETDVQVFSTKAHVIKSWKMALPDDITVVTGDDCAYRMTAGEDYILFLSSGGIATYATYQCRGNRKVSDAKHVLKWLNKLRK